jgi:hypothetical protein
MINIENTRFIEVSAYVQHWEDANLNGKEDINGDIPLRQGEKWKPTIDLASGRVIGWPPGFTADIHYQICDGGEYWLLDGLGARISKWGGYYVPDDLCVGENGFGDYIIFKIGADCLIEGWKPIVINIDEWKSC